MYGKIFDSMYDGTLAENWQALVTFQQMIVLCDADGVVDMTPSALSRRTGIPREVIDVGLEILAAPDEFSRTKDEEGRRIVLIDDSRPWGWYIVNHAKYKSLQDADTVRQGNRDRKAAQRKKNADNKDRESANITPCHSESHSVTPCHGSSLHTDTDTNTNTNTNTNLKTKPPIPPKGVLNDFGFDDFWNIYPVKKSKQPALKAWLKLNPNEQLVATLIANIRRAVTSEEWKRDDGKYIPHASTWINQQRWEDELTYTEARPDGWDSLLGDNGSYINHE